MKRYQVRLESVMSDSFRAVRAANSLDIDVKKKSVHEFSVQAELDAPFSIGLIVGASGSGKTTLARSIFGEDIFREHLDLGRAVIDQFPKEMDYESCAAALYGIGLSSVPCWIKPAAALSNGQRARAEAALALTRTDSDLVVIDEWTSVVDRTVAKVMSHCVQKMARRRGRRIILLSCHYDVTDWLQPDWIIDCNKQTYTDRRSLRRSREERLQFQLREVTRSSWKYFSKYHYLSERIPGGKSHFFGLFHGSDQIGFIAYSNYTPWTDKSKPMIMHANRVVIHPDYAGLGLGIHLMNESAREIKHRNGYRVFAKLSSLPLYTALRRSPVWRLADSKRQIGKMQRGANMDRQSGFRENVKTFSFEYVG